MLIEPTDNSFGAYVSAGSPDALSHADARRRIRRALARYRLLVFPQLSSDPQAFFRIARSLGTLSAHSFVPGLAEERLVHEIRKDPAHVHNFGGTWHSDGAYLHRPPRFILLQAACVPDDGGDTLWACQIAAQRAIPAKLKKRMALASIRHLATSAFGGYAKADPPSLAQFAVHPVLRWLREPQESAVFHSGPCASEIVGLPAQESEGLLNEILGLATTALTFRHRWCKGDIVLWDNRATMHKALNDYPGQLRVMRRALIGRAAPLRAPA